ncbi:hypothetical protein D560_0572 [Bordetella holmesii ATCC 51541]|nr:hypothetical protein D560_0572 [Bordetella holmesii ATCC 51541]
MVTSLLRQNEYAEFHNVPSIADFEEILEAGTPGRNTRKRRSVLRKVEE